MYKPRTQPPYKGQERFSTRDKNHEEIPSRNILKESFIKGSIQSVSFYRKFFHYLWILRAHLFENFVQLFPALGVGWVWLGNIQSYHFAVRVPGEGQRAGQRVGVQVIGVRPGGGQRLAVVGGGGELLGVVGHPLSAHDVEGRIRGEASEVHTTIKQCHHMWNVAATWRMWIKYCN